MTTMFVESVAETLAQSRAELPDLLHRHFAQIVRETVLATFAERRAAGLDN